MGVKIEMRNLKIKIGLTVLVAGALLFVPLNDNYTYGYGESSWLPGSTTNPPQGQNTNPEPGKPQLYQPGSSLLPLAVGNGQVRLNWVRSELATDYTIGYGIKSGQYIYGVSSTGNNTNFTISHLAPGVRYYFAVRATNGGRPGPWSKEWSFVAPGRGGNTNTFVNNFRPQSNPNLSSYNNVPMPTALPVQQLPQEQGQYIPPQVNQGQGNVQPTQAPQVNNPANTGPVQQTQPGLFDGIVNFFKGLFGM